MHLVFDQLPLTQNKSYYQLFSTGHSASSAHYAYETKLVLESDKNIRTSLADQAINPNAQDVSRLYIKWKEEHLGPENGNARKNCAAVQLSTQRRWWTNSYKQILF